MFRFEFFLSRVEVNTSCRLISCLEMFETRALGLGQDLGLLSVKVCAVTSRLSFFLLRFLPDSHRFKVRDMFSAYMTCMVRIEHLLRINWNALLSLCWTFLKIKRVIGLRLFKTAGVFVGANRRTGCKVFGGRVRTICLALSSNFNFLRRLAVIIFTIFGPDEAADERKLKRKPVRIEDEILDASYFRKFSSEQLRGQSCSQDFAIGRGVSSGLVELAECVFVIPLIASPCVARGPALIRTDRIVMRPLEIFPLVMDLGLPFGQLLLFVPIGDFFFFRHWFFERGAFPSGSASGPSWMSVDILVGVVGDITRIHVNVFGFVILRVLCRERKTFRVPLLDGRLPAGVLTGRSFPRGSCSIEWGGEIEPLPVDFGGSAGTDSLGPCPNIFLNSSRVAALACALAADTSATGVWRSVPLPPLRGVCTLSASLVDMSDSVWLLRRQTVGTEIRTVDFLLNKETKKTLVSQRTRISVNYHTSSNQNTRITTIKIRNRKESKVDLIPNLRMSVKTRYKPGLESCRRDSYSPLCSSPRTPYILAPRSHKNGDIPFFPIFTIIFKTSVFIRGNLTFILPRGPSANHAVVHGLLVRKNRRMGLESCFRSLWAVFRLDTFTTSFPRFLIRKDWCRIDVRKGSIATQRPNFDASRSLVATSETSARSLPRYVATELELARPVDRSVATTERARSLRSDRGTIARSLRSDRAWLSSVAT
ncbi:hypothetical protein IGI04_026874 [Brassica rapa subsp. trilocularis]|uniref:Uncharacterized protein n=1 Tax=Brassica rapa subsp. trilocularis TaxID=1813537 RepID=A0ABQ7KYH2_BRACM|nr:hypothetical protein IGI04_026874 [Brassica rapa subsp. trilocularis]